MESERRPKLTKIIPYAASILGRRKNYENVDTYEELAALFDRDKLGKEIAELFSYYVPMRYGVQRPRILELAAGTGIISLELLKRGYNVAVTDKETTGVAKLWEKFAQSPPSGNFIPHKVDINKNIREELAPDITVKFQGVTINSATRYIDDLDTFIDSVGEVMASGGYFIWSFSQTDSLQARFLTRSRITRRKVIRHLPMHNFNVITVTKGNIHFPLGMKNYYVIAQKR